MSDGVKCKCGKMPELDNTMNHEGPENSVHWRLECPKCGHKNAPWRRTQTAAANDWEEKYYKL